MSQRQQNTDKNVGKRKNWKNISHLIEFVILSILEVQFYDSVRG